MLNWPAGVPINLKEYEMIHEKDKKTFDQTARKVKIKVDVSFPDGANVNPIFDKVRDLLAWAATDPDQLDLGLNEKA